MIAVVVFGLWGNATSRWGMLASSEESGVFNAVWDTISFSTNGLVFFWSGVASVNYFIRTMVCDGCLNLCACGHQGGLTRCLVMLLHCIIRTFKYPPFPLASSVHLTGDAT